MDQDLRSFLHDYFRGEFDGLLFKNSMGEQTTVLTGMKGLCGIMAQAIAYFMVEERKFAECMVRSHQRLVEFEQAIKDPAHPVRQFAINVGAIIELASGAYAAYVDKQNGN